MIYIVLIYPCKPYSNGMVPKKGMARGNKHILGQCMVRYLLLEYGLC